MPLNDPDPELKYEPMDESKDNFEEDDFVVTLELSYQSDSSNLISKNVEGIMGKINQEMNSEDQEESKNIRGKENTNEKYPESSHSIFNSDNGGSIGTANGPKISKNYY